MAQETTLFGLKIKLPGGKKETIQDPEQSNEQLIEDLKHFTPLAPGVNLLPPSIKEKYELEKTRNSFIYLIIGLIVVMGILYAGTLAIHSSAQGKIDAVEDENIQLSEQVRQLSQYRSYSDAVDSKRATLQRLFQDDITYDDIVNNLTGAASKHGIELTSLSFGTASEDGGTSCDSPDPFNPSPAIGCITLVANASSMADTVGFTQELNDTEGFVNAFFPSVTVTETEEEGTRVDISGSVAFTRDYSTVRYPDIAIPLEERLFSEDEESSESSEGDQEQGNNDGSTEGEEN